jgi:(p)ppGpp synthase/HD superfamily hydrolase
LLAPITASAAADLQVAMNGYSDRINHALAFAAKHHDQQVRRGTRAPYSTQSANIAVILTRYGCDEDTVVAGILLDVIKDYTREASSREVLESRVGEKFGARVLELALEASERRVDDDGLDLAPDERREDLLRRLGQASREARIVAAAEALHGAGTLLADLRRTVDSQSVWARIAGGRGRLLDSLHRLCDRLAATPDAPPIVDELRATARALHEAP